MTVVYVDFMVHASLSLFPTLLNLHFTPEAKFIMYNFYDITSKRGCIFRATSLFGLVE